MELSASTSAHRCGELTLRGGRGSKRSASFQHGKKRSGTPVSACFARKLTSAVCGPSTPSSSLVCFVRPLSRRPPALSLLAMDSVRSRCLGEAVTRSVYATPTTNAKVPEGTGRGAGKKEDEHSHWRKRQRLALLERVAVRSKNGPGVGARWRPRKGRPGDEVMRRPRRRLGQ